jgi:hypothetical protein
MDLEAVVRRHKEELRVGALAVEVSEEFNLETPCCLVDNGVVVTTSLGALRGYLPCSVALASEPMDRFQALRDRVGFDAAFEAMTADDEVGEEFVRVWDESQQDLANGAVCTLNDLTAMVTQAKKGWQSTPRRVLVVAREGRQVASGLVSTENLR